MGSTGSVQKSEIFKMLSKAHLTKTKKGGALGKPLSQPVSSAPQTEGQTAAPTQHPSNASATFSLQINQGPFPVQAIPVPQLPAHTHTCICPVSHMDFSKV